MSPFLKLKDDGGCGGGDNGDMTDYFVVVFVNVLFGQNLLNDNIVFIPTILD